MNQQSKTLTEVELLGHKAHIEIMGARLADGIWHKEDCITVWLAFDEAVGSILSFAIEIPAVSYTSSAFLRRAVQEGEEQLKSMLKKDEENRRKRQAEAIRQKELDEQVDYLKDILGLS